jgi:hypothetical protein
MKLVRRMGFAASCALMFAVWSGNAAAEDAAPVDDTDGAWMGLFTEKGPEDMAETLSLQKSIGRSFASLMWFTDFGHPFPAKAAENASAAGAIPNVTWEPWLWTDNERIHLSDINSGAWDSYVAAWGAAAAGFGKPLFVRWGHEFNGDWYPWGIAKNGQDPANYVNAYRRVHDLVVRAGAKNVVWVWCPNAGSVPAQPWNDPLSAYPGDAYVDWVAIDGYDFDGNASFPDIFSKVYSQVIAKIDKPIYVGEFATGRTGKDKADWLKEMHGSLTTQFPGIKGLVYFSILKERDWRIDDSPASLAGAREVFSAPFYKSRPEAISRLAERFHRDYASYKKGAVPAAAANRTTIDITRVSRDPAGNVNWSPASSIPVEGKNGLGGVVRLAWDSERLYLQAALSSRYPLTNRQTADGIWNGDCVEVCISTDPTADPARTSFSSTDWQLGFAPADAAKSLPVRSWEWGRLKSQVPGAQIRSFPTDGGYVLEASFPWAALRSFKAEPGTVLGFDLAVDDAGASGTRSYQWIWNGNTQFYNNPAQWGILKLLP